MNLAKMTAKGVRSSLALAVSKAAPNRAASRNYTNWPFLKEEHVMIAETARNFADTELAPIAG